MFNLINYLLIYSNNFTLHTLRHSLISMFELVFEYLNKFDLYNIWD